MARTRSDHVEFRKNLATGQSGAKYTGRFEANFLTVFGSKGVLCRNPVHTENIDVWAKSTGTQGGAEARHSHLRVDCCPANAEEEEAAITDLAGIPE